ncbi:DNA polymerase IV [Flexivirga caeni]|uniref:DNA polymerase IV n=1 Tax=Flexivirga caeni TaxID=2294115 RepID=A0A3M9MHN1_9MICO|nr:DNA polymerase IV [Flexivirga caeni]RNI24685.1 DNA polymerase IV [Flexivirga caeni]
MRSTASIMHLDLDAFFAAVEQRDKPSLRGKPVCVGGIGARGVVATASYEARKFGARSAMPTAEARRRCPPGTAFLYPRGDAYRASSRIVMGLLHEASPLVEQVSVDEAYVDLAASDGIELTPEGVRAAARELLTEIARATGGLTASAGIGSSKMLAKICSDLEKPAGLVVVPPGRELELLAPMSVRVISGVGPATEARLRSFGVETVADLQRMELPDLVSIFGSAHGESLHRLARAQDDRPVVVEREAKSVSAEETFEQDVVDHAVLDAELVSLARRTAARLGKSAMFARTVTIKVRQHDFATSTRSETLLHPTGDAGAILDVARRLLAGVDVSGGLRLLGVGVSGLSTHAQEQLRFDEDAEQELPIPVDAAEVDVPATPAGDVRRTPGPAAYSTGPPQWWPGQDVEHEVHGAGWVWGSGLGRVTVRFEGPTTVPGPVRTFRARDAQLSKAGPPRW